MFKTARMRKIRIVTLDKYVAPTVDALHAQGLVQISDISDSIQQDPELAELVTPSKASPYTGKLSSLLMKTNGTAKIDCKHILLVEPHIVTHHIGVLQTDEESTSDECNRYDKLDGQKYVTHATTCSRITERTFQSKSRWNGSNVIGWIYTADNGK